VAFISHFVVFLCFQVTSGPVSLLFKRQKPRLSHQPLHDIPLLAIRLQQPFRPCPWADLASAWMMQQHDPALRAT
jgi:hypothetical protein